MGKCGTDVVRPKYCGLCETDKRLSLKKLVMINVDVVPWWVVAKEEKKCREFRLRVCSVPGD